MSKSFDVVQQVGLRKGHSDYLIVANICVLAAKISACYQLVAELYKAI